MAADGQSNFSSWSLAHAFEHFLPLWGVDWSTKTLKIARDRMKPLFTTFGEVSLKEISLDSVLSYRVQRKAAGVSNRTINMEIALLRRVMKSAQADDGLLRSVKALRENQTAGRALAGAERQKLSVLARMRPEWFNAWSAMELALNTTLRGCEIRQLRWKDIDFSRRLLVVEQSKTEAGERVIPLNEAALGAIARLSKRALELNALRPGAFLFMACENGRFDPLHPIRSWRSAWRSLTRAAGLPGLRFHDLRHTAITDLLESDRVSEATAMQIAGHISRRMLRHYSHIRIEAMRVAVEEIGQRGWMKDLEFQPFDEKTPVPEKIQ